MRKFLLIVVLLVFSACAVQAAPFAVIIGDKDGFGFNGVDGPSVLNNTGPWSASNASGAGRLLNALGANADSNSDGILEPQASLSLPGLGPIGSALKEYLPDIDGDGFVRANSVDNWDNRDASEAVGGADVGVTYVGASTNGAGSKGVQWTDISLSRTYADPRRTQDNALGVFPDPAGPAVPNNAVFDFEFILPKSGFVNKKPIDFALVFGDYDVANPSVPDVVEVAGQFGTITIPLIPQSLSTDPGLVQLAAAQVPFDDIFADGITDWLGKATVTVKMPTDPYYSIDYVAFGALGLDAVPEPGTYALFGLGALGLLFWRRRRSA